MSTTHTTNEAINKEKTAELSDLIQNKVSCFEKKATHSNVVVLDISSERWTGNNFFLAFPPNRK